MLYDKMLKDKNNYQAVAFYQLVEDSLEKEEQVGNAVNGILHVWGYFKNAASDKEKDKLLENIKAYKKGKISLIRVKNILKKLALKYKENYLLDSYYFIII